MCECVLVEEKREKERDECGAGKRAEIEGEVWASFGLEGAGKTPNTLCGIGAKMITNVTMLVNVTMFEMYAMQTQSAFGEQEMETACAEGIAWCPVYTVCTVSSVYSVQCIQCPVCTVSSVQCVQCIQCPVCPVSSVYSVQCPVSSDQCVAWCGRHSMVSSVYVERQRVGELINILHGSGKHAWMESVLCLSQHPRHSRCAVSENC